MSDELGVMTLEEAREWYEQRFNEAETFDILVNQVRAEAWDEGALAAWDRSTPEVNGVHYHWRSSGQPLNPYRKEATR